MTQPSNEYSIIYTIKKPAAEDPSDDVKNSPFLLRALVATDFPDPVIERFKPSKQTPWLPRHGQQAPPANLHVIVSTGSGTGLASAIWAQLVRPLLEYIGLDEEKDYQLHFTSSETSITELVENTLLPKANDGMDQTILLLSGDGGLVDIVNAILPGYRPDNYKKPSISLLPLGTGNAMANSSGITGDSTLGLSTMLRGSPKEVPLFRATFSPGARMLVNQGQDERPLQGEFDGGKPCAYGAVVCSWGLHATLVADSDTVEYRKFGAERFKMAGKEALFPSDGSLPHAYQGRVSIRREEESEWERIAREEHGYVLATLVSQLEAGFSISPSSKPLDGKLRLVHFGRLGGKDAMEIMGKAYDGGKHISDERVGYEEIDGLRIDFDEEDARWRRVCLDGKIIRVEKGGWVEVQGDAGGVVDLVSSV